MIIKKKSLCLKVKLLRFKNKPKRAMLERLKMTLLIIFLFIICVGGVELAICYWHDPHIFKKIVTPVQNTAKSAVSHSKQLALDAGDWLSDRKNWFEKQIKNLGTAISQRQKASEKKADDDKQEQDSLGVMTRVNGVETLTGGNISITYFAQNDPEWKEKLYGNDPIGVYGCGPTTMAMVVNSLGAGQTDPEKMAAFCAESGYWAPKSGSYHNIVQGVAAAFGLTYSAPISLSTDELTKRLSDGEIAVALMGPGHFTDTGHFIVLRGISKDGKVLVADPISRTRSLSEWDAQLIIDELSMSRSSGAPLWFLSHS